jgi:outer membrane lipoprotein-sorting protein
MKKIVWLGLIVFLFLLTGCGKYGEKDIVKDLNKKIDGCKGYYLEAQMEIINNEDIYKYDVKVSYQNDDLFRVSLKNKANSHEQILLRNEEGVYVLTPSLNKSFKFQSEWPYNNSHAGPAVRHRRRHRRDATRAATSIARRRRRTRR